MNDDTFTLNADITFSATAFPSATTITLESNLTLRNTAHSITIDGTGAGPITVSGNHAVQVFQANGGVTALIENVTVSEGYFSGSILEETGGSAVTNSGTLTLENCTFSANYAHSGSYYGTILNSGTITIENCAITGNTCSDAAGVDNIGIATIVSSTFSNNNAIADPYGNCIVNDSASNNEIGPDLGRHRQHHQSRERRPRNSRQQRRADADDPSVTRQPSNRDRRGRCPARRRRCCHGRLHYCAKCQRLFRQFAADPHIRILL